MYFSRVIVAVVAATLCSLAAAQRLEFKGAPFGASPEAVKDAIGTWARMDCEEGLKLRGDGSCRFLGVTFANQPTGRIVASFRNNGLTSVLITVEPNAFDAVSAAIIEKYGKPQSSSSSTVRNNTNAQFKQRVLGWNTADGGRIAAVKYSAIPGPLDSGLSTITLLSKEAQAVEQEETRKLGPAKKDI